MGAGWSVVIDRDKCMSSGVCVVYAPGTFSQDESAKAVVVDGAAEDLETVQVAVEACPTHALTLLIDDEGA